MVSSKLKFVLLALGVLGLPSLAAADGPVVLMGIDAEDGGLGVHGPVAVYADVVASILADVTNGGTGLLVIGGGKGIIPDDVAAFWNAVGVELGEAVTLVSGTTAIAAQSFTGFAVLVVASSEVQTPAGGLTDAENNALAARSSDIASLVNGGGGLLGLTQIGLTDPYAYISGIFDPFTEDTEDAISLCDLIEPTAEGLGIGITDALDVCCWHEAYDDFPDFLKVLAIYRSGEFCSLTGRAAAIGGRDVILPGCGDGILDPDEECDDGGAVDGDGCSASCEIENNPPDCLNRVAVVWPPNHKFVEIAPPPVTDPDGDPVSITVIGIRQDEPLNFRGDGNTCPDAIIVGSSASVRAERSGRRDGRVYHLTYRAEDGLGGECTGFATVCVPHDQRRGMTCIDQGPLFDSTRCE